MCPLITEIERALGSDELITKDKSHLVTETEGLRRQWSPRHEGGKFSMHAAQRNRMVVKSSLGGNHQTSHRDILGDAPQDQIIKRRGLGRICHEMKLLENKMKSTNTNRNT